MSVRRPTARTTTPNFVTVTVDGKKFSLRASRSLTFRSNQRTLFSDEYNKSNLYSLCRKLAKQAIREGLENRNFGVFKKNGQWYEDDYRGWEYKERLLPPLREQDFYNEIINLKAE